MQIISLNTWGGRAGHEALLDFFKTHAATDIFCLQEIWAAAYEHLEGVHAGGVALDHEQIMTRGLQEISKALSGHTPFFRPHHGDNYGLLLLVRKEIAVLEEGDIFVYKERGYVPEGDVGGHARNIQYVTVETVRGPLTVINFHGLWTGTGPGQGKNDSADRLEQSARILAFTEKLPNPFVLCGDFNLLPETESLQMFERAGLRNLIKESGVTSTRTRFYEKPAKFADYAFVSPGIELNKFSVLPDEVSDHAPLLIDVA